VDIRLRRSIPTQELFNTIQLQEFTPVSPIINPDY
jgi:hypothetical protein